MSLIFDDAVDVVLADPAFSVPATFTPRPTGTLVNCRAIIQRRDPDIRVARSGALNPAWRVMVKRAEIPVRPKHGDIIAILADRYAGTYVVHSTREDSFAATWDLDIGGQARFPTLPVGGGGGSLLHPHIGVPLTILDATHVQFPDVPDASGVLIFVNNLACRPVTSSPGLNESLWTGGLVASLGPGSLDPINDVVWALYFS